MIVMYETRNTIWLWAEQEGGITQRNGRYVEANGGEVIGKGCIATGKNGQP